MSKVSRSKLGSPPTAAITGVRRSATTDFTTSPKAAPRITAVARSSRFPRKMKLRNSFSIDVPPGQSAAVVVVVEAVVVVVVEVVVVVLLLVVVVVDVGDCTVVVVE